MSRDGWQIFWGTGRRRVPGAMSAGPKKGCWKQIFGCMMIVVGLIALSK